MTYGPRLLRVGALVALALVLAGCASHKQEAASLVAAVDRFHKAENVDKAERQRAIAEVVCVDADVCEAKHLCATATASTAQGLLLKAEVEKGLAALEQGTLAKTDEGAKALPSKLDEAGRLLGEGHVLMPVCDQKILALRGKYDL